MLISFIVAADEHNGIGAGNQLLCYLPADLRYFKQTTMGHHIVMGRKTFDSVGKPLPGRTNIVVSRQEGLLIPGCEVVRSVEEAIALAAEHGEKELFITGGATIYQQLFEAVHKIYLTRIHHTFEADTFFPDLAPDEWKLLSSEPHPADEKNKYAYTFLVYERLP